MISMQSVKKAESSAMLGKQVTWMLGKANIVIQDDYKLEKI